uniref:Uncharacterized protein n=1 Tax=Avena sativa TaxID=4498 RepID=A0ACD5VMK0_AVESA
MNRSIPVHDIMIPLLVLLFVASFLWLAPPAGAACSPKRCGNLTVAYPFWLEEAGQPPCGSPSFQLRCNATTAQALLVHSLFGMYQVVEIFAENSSFVAVDNNLPLDDGCLPRWFNISAGFGLTPFVISKKNRELLVLYNCTERQRSTPQGFLRTLCADESFYHMGGEYSTLHDYPGDLPPDCRLSVVPVLGFPGDDESSGLVGSMKGGFLLEWTLASDNCPRCVASGGQCNYTNDGAGFFCNCSGVARPGECGEIKVPLVQSSHLCW